MPAFVRTPIRLGQAVSRIRYQLINASVEPQYRVANQGLSTFFEILRAPSTREDADQRAFLHPVIPYVCDFNSS
jgi:hypothetical protein